MLPHSIVPNRRTQGAGSRRGTNVLKPTVAATENDSMKPAALGLFAAGAVAFVVSLFMPANQDWLGFLWAAFAFEIVLRGPQGAADYTLFLLVSVSNLLALVSPFAFAGARSGGRVVAHLLLLATIGSVVACLHYRPRTWDAGYYVWCGALAAMTIAIYMRAAALTTDQADVHRLEPPTPLRRSA